jgi:flavin reductase (DIM6/NTAB) family NADH-FMN oxidoreductase RutF
VVHIVARVEATHPAGDHLLYVGRVEYLDYHDGTPLLFYAGEYRELNPQQLARVRWTEDEFALFTIGPG